MSTRIRGTRGEHLALTVYGATSVENQYIIDGVNTTNVIKGFQGKAINGEFIQEVEVKTGGYQAGVRPALGGVINVITKSGGNEFHGDGFAYYDSFSCAVQARVIDEQRLLPGDAPQLQRNDFGAGLGGRIITDRLWFFAAYDRLEQADGHLRFNDSGLVSHDDKFPAADSVDNLYSG